MTFLRHIETAIVAVIVSLAMVIAVSVVVAADRPEAHIYQKFKQAECYVCGSTQDLEWAHAFPYALSTNGLEYLRVAETNGITLCRDDHFRIAHYGNWKKWNANLIPICKELRESRKEQEKTE